MNRTRLVSRDRMLEIHFALLISKVLQSALDEGLLPSLQIHAGEFLTKEIRKILKEAPW